MYQFNTGAAGFENSSSFETIEQSDLKSPGQDTCSCSVQKMHYFFNYFSRDLYQYIYYIIIHIMYIHYIMYCTLCIHIIHRDRSGY
jgi:hypothetical protein